MQGYGYSVVQLEIVFIDGVSFLILPRFEEWFYENVFSLCTIELHGWRSQRSRKDDLLSQVIGDLFHPNSKALGAIQK